jgi:DnaK suppressor protein
MEDRRARERLEAQLTVAAARVDTMTAELVRLRAATADSNLDDEHDPEGSTIAFERAQLTTLLDQAREQTAGAEAALARLSAGDYGLCERCGSAIGDARLDAVPLTRLCIGCASRRR